MTKLLHPAYIVTLLLLSCGQSAKNKVAAPKKILAPTNEFSGMHGTWLRENKGSFTLIEIKDTANVLYYEVSGKRAYSDSIYDSPYWYYKSKAKIGYWDRGAIWIGTDKYRFDYKVKGDTLIEFDKMGDQGIFLKIYTEDEADFKIFNTANLRGKITHVVNVSPFDRFVLDNMNREYSFSSITDGSLNKKSFGEIAEVGDSVIKPSYGDSLTLFNKKTGQYFRFGFERR